MKYLMMIYNNEPAMLGASKEQTAETLAAYAAYTEALQKSGALVGSNRLRPSTNATTAGRFQTGTE